LKRINIHSKIEIGQKKNLPQKNLAEGKEAVVFRKKLCLPP